MRRAAGILTSVGLVLILGVGPASAQYITIAPPGATNTFVTGVSGGDVVGYSDIGNSTYGFLYNGTTYTTISVPGSNSTEVYGISGDQVVGSYQVTSNGYTTTWGFLYEGGYYSTFAPPGAVSSSLNAVSGGLLVGSSDSYPGVPGQGFVYNELLNNPPYNAGYTTVSPPGASYSGIGAISGSNILGAAGLNGGQFGFVYNGSTYTIIAPPGATEVDPQGISGNDVVGNYQDSSGKTYAFLYNGTTYSNIVVPGSAPGSTQLLGISGGDVFGDYQSNLDGNTYGFFSDGTTYTSISPPGATYTQVTAISGDLIVGDYGNGTTQVGFLYGPSVPEPSGIFLLGVGIVMIAAYLARHQVR